MKKSGAPVICKAPVSVPAISLSPRQWGLLILTSPDSIDKERDSIMKHEDDNDITGAEKTLLPLVKEIRDLVQSARRAASWNVNTLQVATNFEIGRRIVEYEQQGSKRAEYGKRILNRTLASTD